MKDKINLEILNNFINLILLHVAIQYLYKVKKERKKPPEMIKNYLDKSLLLLKTYKPIEIASLKNTIDALKPKEQKEFNNLFEINKEYEPLCEELNFAYLLIVDEKLQDKTLESIYDNVYEYILIFESGKKITEEHVDIYSVIKDSKKTKKVNKVYNYCKTNSNYAEA